ncbi:MAG: flagellar cap protein [Firmicutes bacterium]|nr:flagellar cap protein [Bacillota bacterium]
MRIGGLASGMDIDQIVSDLMKAERMKVDKLEQEKQELEWKQEDYRELNNKMRSLRDLAFDMKLQGSYLKNSASSSDKSILTATTGSDAVEGTYSVIVENLAKSAYTVSSAEINAYQDTLEAQFGVSSDITFTVTNSGIKDVNGNSISKEFTFTKDQSLKEMVSEINNWKNTDGIDLGVKLSYDEGLNRVFVQTTETGTEQSIKISSSDSTTNNFLYDDLKLTEFFTADPSSGGVAQTLTGEDAKVTFNGTNFTFSSNTADIAGIKLNLTSVSPIDGVGNYVPTSVTVKRDTEAVFDSIVKFIDKYNETVKTINDKLYEEYYRDYKPLTDQRREQLTDDQIEKWQDKARSGLLHNDPILSSVVSKMRMTMGSMVPGVNSTEGYDRLDDLGIKTTENYMSGELVINEDKLRKSLQNDLEGVMSLFTKSAEDYDDKGIAQRLYDDLDYGIDSLISRAGSSDDYSLVDDSFIGKEMKGIDKDIERWEDRLVQIEDRYWRQFSAMEKAIQQMNQQSAWLAQQFGGGM